MSEGSRSSATGPPSPRPPPPPLPLPPPAPPTPIVSCSIPSTPTVLRTTRPTGCGNPYSAHGAGTPREAHLFSRGRGRFGQSYMYCFNHELANTHPNNQAANALPFRFPPLLGLLGDSETWSFASPPRWGICRVEAAHGRLPIAHQRGHAHSP